MIVRHLGRFLTDTANTKAEKAANTKQRAQTIIQGYKYLTEYNSMKGYASMPKPHVGVSVPSLPDNEPVLMFLFSAHTCERNNQSHTTGFEGEQSCRD